MKYVDQYNKALFKLAGIVLGFSILFATCTFVEADTAAVAPPDSHPYGLSYGEWGARWWQWAYSIPKNVNPFADDETGIECGINQTGPVWFLAGTSGKTVTRTCTIPNGMAIFLPIININNDYPCPEPPPFEPAPGQSLEAFLTEGAEAFIAQVKSHEVDLDGNSLTDFRATSELFGFTAAKDLVDIDSCITGSPQLGVTDGFWIMLRPLPSGDHTLHFKAVQGAAPNVFSTEVTYHLTIGK